MTPVLLVIIKLAVAGMIFATGMASRPADIAGLLRQPVLLGRSLLAIYVAVPAVVLLGIWLLPLPAGFKTALLVLAASGGAPLLPRRLMKLGNPGYVLGLIVVSSLLAVIIVPPALQLFAVILGSTPVLTTGSVARVLAITFLLPLAAGMAIGWIWRDCSAAWAETMLKVMGAALIGAAVLLLATHWPVLLAAGWLPLATLVLFSASALAVGHVIGGPAPADRAALAVICCTRHLGIVALLAASIPGPRTIVLMLAYVLAAAAVTTPYLRCMRGRIAVTFV